MSEAPRNLVVIAPNTSLDVVFGIFPRLKWSAVSPGHALVGRRFDRIVWAVGDMGSAAQNQHAIEWLWDYLPLKLPPGGLVEILCHTPL